MPATDELARSWDRLKQVDFEDLVTWQQHVERVLEILIERSQEDRKILGEMADGPGECIERAREK